MRFSKQTAGWCKVYLAFPFCPVVIETLIRLLLISADVSFETVPAYASALVCTMAVSIFVHDELKKYNIPDPNDELTSELAGNRYTMFLYFLLACCLFAVYLIVSILATDWKIVALAGVLNIIRAVSIIFCVLFIRHTIKLQAHYKLAVAS